MILITGGAGTLGKAFKEYLGDDAIAIDSNEWAVAENPSYVLGDYVNHPLRGLTYVIHCAAYKHINLGEENAPAFVDNNITKLAEFFKRVYEAKLPVLFISTDKAVEPISLYGYTKAVGEELAKHYGFTVARLPNIMSSSGSVIPTWEKQIAEGKPITITHTSMVRHFCNVDEAVREIWERFLGGEKLIVPKCEKISINTLLQKALDKHGVKDKPLILITGLRHREKLSEKLFWEHELGRKEE